ncbi:MAG: EAL domain-containing protein [Eggerthellaceae bacterium]
MPVGRWVLREAIAWCKRWSAIDPAFVMSVNLSYRQLDEESLVELIHELLDDAALPADNLVVEMTESYFAPGDVVAKQLFDEIRELGVQVAMDDFGTGCSTLGVLKSSPADIVKIDKTFVRDIQTSTFDATFIRFVVALCHDVGIRVCLEGVETDDNTPS